MGNSSSSDNYIAKQEAYVKERKKAPDMQYLKHGFFRGGSEKYTNRQIEGYLRQEYNRTRHEHPDSYVLNSDLRIAQKHGKP